MTSVIVVSVALCVYFAVIDGQTLPSIEPIPVDVNSTNASSIVSPYDTACMTANNCTESDGVVYIGAVGLNTENECEVICQQQMLQRFQIILAGTIRTRAIVLGSIFTAQMPDNSTCAQTGMCSGGVCSGGANTTDTSANSTDTETTTMMANTTMATTMADNSTSTDNSTTNSTAL